MWATEDDSRILLYRAIKSITTTRETTHSPTVTRSDLKRRKAE